MRIEPVRRKPDRSEIECRAENGAGDPVFAQASLTIFDGEFFTRSFVMPAQCAKWILNKLQTLSVRPLQDKEHASGSPDVICKNS